MFKKKKKSVLDNFNEDVKHRDEEYGDYGILKCRMKELIEKYNKRLYTASIYGNYGHISFNNPIPEGILCEIESSGLRITEMKEDNNYDYTKKYTRMDLKLKEKQLQ